MSYIQKSYFKKFGNKDNSMESKIIEDVTYLVDEVNKLEDSSRPYRSFTALLYQDGGSDRRQMRGDGEGDLGVARTGTTVYIALNPNGKDYSSIGAPSSDKGTWFILTRDISYEDLDIDTVFNIDLGAPLVVSLLENSIGNIWFTYNDIGQYSINSNELFNERKTYLSINPLANQNTEWNAPIYSFFQISTNELTLRTLSAIKPLAEEPAATETMEGERFIDGYLNYTPIEIRVYN